MERLTSVRSRARASATRRRVAVFAALCLAGLASLAATAGSASAATTSLTAPTSISGDSTLASQPFNQTVLGVTASGTAAITMHWSQAASVATEWDPNLVRQGRSLDPSDSYARTVPGSMSVDYELQGFHVGFDSNGLDLGSPGFTTSGTCNLIAGGSDYSCHLVSNQVTLFDLFPLPGPYVKLKLVSDVTISPEGLATLRQATFGGNPDGTANLSLGESPLTDALAIGCSVGTGDELVYSLGQVSTTPGISMETSLEFDVGAEFPTPVTVVPEIDIQFASPSIPLGTTTGGITMTGAGADFDLGAVQHNNIPPTVDSGGALYAGSEGTAIAFDGSASSSICGFPTLRWDFSDGGVAFGKSPHHTFTDNGSFSGLLTATDATGLTSTTTFSINVDNVAPSVNAGPDTSDKWGQPVAFNGQATDPGSSDQSTLQYTWSFGDGSPSASGGPSVVHSYAVPSSPAGYLATLTVCDKDGGCNSSTRHVVIAMRGTTTAYTGPLSSLPSKSVTLSASLTDEFGQPVQGRLLHFVVGSQTADATTGAGGTASATIKLNQKKGVYPLSVSFAGDSKYGASASGGSGTFKVG